MYDTMSIKHIHIQLDEEAFGKLKEIKEERNWTWREMLTINEGVVAKKDVEDIEDEEIVIAPPKGSSSKIREKFEEIAEPVNK